MRDWGLNAYVDDVVFVAHWIRENEPGSPLYVGGISLGAILAEAVVDREPTAFAGLIAWEGGLRTDDPELIDENVALCNKLENKLDKGKVEGFYELVVFKGLAQRYRSFPGRWQPLGLFLGHPFTSNRDFFYLAGTMTIGGPYGEHYTYVTGDWRTHRFDSAVESFVFSVIDDAFAYEPTALSRDYTCVLGRQQPFGDGLGQFQGRTFAIGHERGFGTMVDDIRGLLPGEAPIDVRLWSGMAHADAMLGLRHAEVFDQPVIDWIRQ